MSEATGGSAHIRGTKPADAVELRVRTVFVSIVVAAIMGASYPYIVLKIGFGPNVSVVAAFFGFLFLGLFFRNFNRWENNIVQTAGTSAAQTAFMCILLAAFDMIAFRDPTFSIKLDPVHSFVWLTAAGLLGVLLAVPFRQHFVVDEKLTYADGVAAGETLIVLDSRGGVAQRAVRAMFIGTLASAAFMAIREDGQILNWMHEGWLVAIPLLANMNVGVSYGFLAVGSGMLVGLRINASMLLGGVLSWVIGPYLVTHYDWITQAKDLPTRTEVLAWTMWPATAMLIAGGLTGLALRWRVLVKTFTQLKGAGAGNSQDFPIRWVIGGSLVSGIALIAFQQITFGIPIWMTLIAITLSIVLMLIGLRVLGETNWGPISSLSNLMQVFFAGVAPGNVNAIMVASGTTGTVASCSEAIMQDYKAGDMIGSTPRLLTWSQLIAVPIGAAAVAWMYPLLRDTYGIVGDGAQLASPTSARWANFALVLKDGFDRLPTGALEAAGVFAVLGIIITVLEGNKSLKKFLPSPTGVGIGMLVPFSAVATMFIGGVLGYLWEKQHKQSSDELSAPLASGLIAGEAILAVVVPLLYLMKILPL
jgi:uncharacterized oligopeptide transporter (OPT) family protein